MDQIKRFIAKPDKGHKHYAGCYFEVEAETLDEAREILIKDQFNGHLYEETYQFLTTTSYHITIDEEE